MLLEVKLRLTRAFLGEMKPDERGVRRFKMLNRRIHVNQSDWRERLRLACRNVQYDVDVNTIIPPTSYEPATIHDYPRRHSGTKIEFYEAFRAGTVLTMDFIVREDMSKAPDPHQFKTLLSFVGEHFGFSQWGNSIEAGRKDQGLGRFIVQSVEAKQYDKNYGTDQPSSEVIKPA